jgi:hypothetical protein
MLRFEVGKVFLILHVLRGLFVLCQFGIVLLLCGLCLTLEEISGIGCQDLPALTHNLSDLRERKLLPLELFSDFCSSQVSDVLRGSVVMIAYD